MLFLKDDCGTDKGKFVHPIFDTDDNEALGYKLYQAYLADPVNNPKPSSKNLQGVKLNLGQKLKDVLQRKMFMIQLQTSYM